MVATTVDVAAKTDIHTNTGCGVLSLHGGETVTQRSRLGRGSKWAVRQIVLSTAPWNKQRSSFDRFKMSSDFSELNVFWIMIHES